MQGLSIIKDLRNFGARERGVVQKHSFCGCRASGIIIVSMPQKACSALLRGFVPRSRDREPELFLHFIYNADIHQILRPKYIEIFHILLYPI